MAAAVKSVMFKTLETKKFVTNYFVNVLYPFSAATTYSVCHPFLSDLPRSNNTLTRSDYTFVGNQIYLKGIKFWPLFTFTTSGGTLPVTGIRVRMSIISTADRVSSVIGPAQFGAPLPAWFEEGAANPPTMIAFNTERVTVLKSWTRTLNYAAGNQHIIPMKKYVRVSRKMTANSPGSTSVNTFFGDNKGKNLWWIFEIYNLSGVALSNTSCQLQLDKFTYFKDA